MNWLASDAPRVIMQSVVIPAAFVFVLLRGADALLGLGLEPELVSGTALVFALAFGALRLVAHLHRRWRGGSSAAVVTGEATDASEDASDDDAS